MAMAHDAPLTVEEIATRLKCSRGWIQLSIDAGCPTDEQGRVSLRDFMLYQLSNIHRVRRLAGLPPLSRPPGADDLRGNVKAVLTTQLEWLQQRSTRATVKSAARLVCDKINALEDI